MAARKGVSSNFSGILESSRPKLVLDWQTIVIAADEMHTEETRRALFQSAVEQHADSVYRVAFRMSGNHELARELVQETFLAGWKNLDQVDQPDRIRAWLMGILRNQFSKQLAKEARHRHGTLEAEPISGHPDAMLQGSVQAAIARLDEDHRLPILLVTMEGWSTEEVAEMLDIPRGTVLSRLYRARQQLKLILAPDWEVESKT
jgi:RNA polymerase sigma-70 factor (ECF subfamily)